MFSDKNDHPILESDHPILGCPISGQPRRPHGIELGFAIANAHHILPAFSLVGVFDDALHRGLALTDWGKAKPTEMRILWILSLIHTGVSINGTPIA